jgi:hypothetical protein
MGMKYRVTARNLVSFEMNEIIEAADLAAQGVDVKKRVATGHLEPVADYDRPKKKTSSNKEPESE